MTAVLSPLADTPEAASDVNEEAVPTTESQREVWVGALLGPDSALAFHNAMRLRLDGELDVPALTRAVSLLVARHQSLRATVAPDGASMRIAHPTADVLQLQDLRVLDDQARALELAAAHRRAVENPSALEAGPLFQAVLLRVAAAEHELLMSAHQLVCDGWSWAVVVSQLGQLYAEQVGHGPGERLRPAPRLADFASAQAAERAQPQMQAHVDYWMDRFSGGSLPVLELPTDRPRPPVRTFASRHVERWLSPQRVDEMRVAAQKQQIPLFTGLFSAFVATLHRLGGQDDMVVGIAAAGQPWHRMPDLVGHCVNLLPLRIAVQGPLRFDALMERCEHTRRDALAHQSLSYGALLGRLALPRDPSRQPLVSAIFHVEPDPDTQSPNFPGLAVTQSSLPRSHGNFELSVNLRPKDGGLLVEAQYNSGLFDEASVQCWLDMYDCLLQSAAADPAQTVAQLGVLSAEATRALLALQPAPTALLGRPLAHAGFEARVQLHPQRLAVRDGAHRCSYGELDARANRLAHALRERGMRRGERVGLCLARGTDMIVALLAVLKSGAAYVPLDPGFPQARLDDYAQDAGLGLMLTTSDIPVAPRHWRPDAGARVFEIDRDTAWLRASDSPLVPSDADAGPEDMAYVIYTSGSTGRPKGVRIAHLGVANFIESMIREPGLGESDRVAAVTTLCFDIAVAELLLPLAAGAEIVMVQREAASDGAQLRAVLEEHDITMLQATPGMWQMLRDARWPGSPRLRGWIGGEPVRARLAFDLLDGCAQLWNVYGPTETTVWSTVWRMEREAVRARGVSIGRPIGNTQVWILDAQMQPCPIGVPGEICIGGAGVALGYLDRPEVTAERFVNVRIFGTVHAVYRTGDRGRWCHDGLLEHLGRLDFQVKVRGHRIEPGEIEARCNEVPGVARSVVVAREDRPGDVRLVAYLSAQRNEAGAALDVKVAARYLREVLPTFMLPQHVVMLPTLPTLPNGKLDRQALPAPRAVPRTATHAGATPASATQRKVLAAMEYVLSLPGMDLLDDFFAKGGHSLLAARLAALLSREFQRVVPLRVLFEAPTAQQLAAAIDVLCSQDGKAPVTLACGYWRESAPLTPRQEHLCLMEDQHPGRSVYNAPSAQRLRGEFDAARFKTAMSEVIRRQPALRTRIGIDARTGQRVQRIEAQVALSLPMIDLCGLPPDQREAELAERMQELADRPIDISRAPMAHAALLRIDENEHVFVFVPHELVWDDWSFDLLQAELSALYDAAERGLLPTLAAVATTHGDYAEWLAHWMDTPACAREMNYWRQQLAAVAPVRLPNTDMPRRTGGSGQGGTQWISIDLPRTQRLREVAHGMGVTLALLCLGIHALTLGHVLGSPTVVVAHPVRGRQHPQTEQVMGAFDNVLTVCLPLDMRLTLPTFMHAVKRTLLAALDHQQLPFECVAADTAARGAHRGGIRPQTRFSFQDVRERLLRLGSLQAHDIPLVQRGATGDIGLWLLDRPQGLEGALVYNADLYLRETGAQLRDRFLELLDRTAVQPDATLEQLADGTGSASAAYLRKLATDLPCTSTASALASPAPGAAGVAHTEAGSPMLSPQQARLARIWADVIDIDFDEIRAEDNFFDLGGDSLLVQRAVEQAAKTLNHRVEPRRYLFESLAQIAGQPHGAESAVADGRAVQSGAPVEALFADRARGLVARTLGAWLRRG